MHMPKLLKRFSERNLTKRLRARSASEDQQTPNRPKTSNKKHNTLPLPDGHAPAHSYPPPNYPLPLLVKDEKLVQSLGSQSPAPLAETIELGPASRLESSNKTQNDVVEDSSVPNKSTQLTLTVTSAKELSSSTASALIISKEPPVVKDDLLTETWSVLNSTPSTGGPSILQTAENAVTTIQQTYTHEKSMLTATTTAVQSMVPVQTLEREFNSYLDGSPTLLKVLGEVGKLHPFVGVAVATFQIVWSLEMTRRGNDKKIITLYVEMKDMMKVLLQLRGEGMKEKVKIKTPDGRTMEGKLEELAKTTAEHIKACAHLCDTYKKKKLVVKVLTGASWETRFLDYIKHFANLKNEFQLALTIHSVNILNTTNNKIDAITEKMTMITELFKCFITPEQQKIVAFVKEKGGPDACRQDTKILRELAELEPESAGSAHGDEFGSKTSSGPNNTSSQRKFDDLLKDLETSIDDSLKANFMIFQGKFEIQQRQLKEELILVARRESDRVIGALTSGPHDKILDKDVFELWKEMNWRGSIKSKHFVLALKDYFHEKWSSNKTAIQATENSEAISPRSIPQQGEDEWALVYFNVIRLQSVTEAFDDDGSGFITTAEVNVFTSSRPLGWSLPHWIAYWAAGWEQTMVEYVDKIRDIIDKMFSILPNIRMENQGAVNRYLRGMYDHMSALQQGVNYYPRNYLLQAQFASYVEAEETRLRERLEEIAYDIDTEDTLSVVTGPGRLERFLLPICYLLLKQHFEIFRVARNRLLHRDELWDALDTISWVFDAVKDRVKILESSFKHQKLDVSQQFKNFAHGLYQYCFDDSSLWAPSTIRAMNIPEYPYNDYLEKNPPNEKVCNYPLDKTDKDYAIYDVHHTNPAPQPNERYLPALNAMLGTWNGYIYDTYETTFGMITLIIYPKDSEDNTNEFVASGRSNLTEWDLTGSCKATDDPNIVNFTLIRSCNHHDPQEWEGRIDLERGIFFGRLKQVSDSDWSQRFTFFFSRKCPDIVRFRPAPISLEVKQSKTSLLWRFALNAILNQVRRENWYWSYFAERRRNRKRFIELFIRQHSSGFGRPLKGPEKEEFECLLLRLRATDSRYYHSLALHEIRITVNHGVYCDNCNGAIGGSRVMCLVCQAKNSWNSVDLCEDPECLLTKGTRDDLPRPHLPTHDMLKIRRVMHIRNVGHRERQAHQALTACRKYMDEREWCQGNKVDERPICILCRDKVTIPCWYCVDCEEHHFICDSCDQKDSQAWCNYKGPHVYHLHDLVRCKILVEDKEMTVEDRLTSIEDRIVKMEGLLERLVEQKSNTDV